MSLEAVTAVADAVLYEGYLLYPYRANSAKNQMRWQFGVLVPPSYARDDIGEHSWQRTEVLVRAQPQAKLRWRVRFLHLERRWIEADSGDGYTRRGQVEVGGEIQVSFDEAVAESVEMSTHLGELLAGRKQQCFAIAAFDEVQPLAAGVRRHRRREPLRVRVELSASPVAEDAFRVTAEVHCETRWEATKPTRDEAVRHSLIGCHTVAEVSSGQFVSLLDPPPDLAQAAAACENVRTWPVLGGPPGQGDVVLSAPLILYDHPAVAPESPAMMFDSTEVDELLVLRTQTLTDDEKAQARATDPRARELIDLADNLPPELLDRLHGAIRELRPAQAPGDPCDVDPFVTDMPWWDPGADTSADPFERTVLVDGVTVGRGSRVRLRLGARRTDAQDMFLAGRAATVHGVLLDVDGSHHVAVTIDDDPGVDLQIAQGRYRYYAPDEVEPMTPVESS